MIPRTDLSKSTLRDFWL